MSAQGVRVEWFVCLAHYPVRRFAVEEPGGVVRYYRRLHRLTFEDGSTAIAAYDEDEIPGPPSQVEPGKESDEE